MVEGLSNKDVVGVEDILLLVKGGFALPDNLALINLGRVREVVKELKNYSKDYMYSDNVCDRFPDYRLITVVSEQFLIKIDELFGGVMEDKK